jgi:hypothetical protein
MGVIGFFLGLLCGLILGAALVAIAAIRSLRREARHHPLTVTVGRDDRLRISTDPRQQNAHLLAQLRTAWEREHPESEVRGIW